MKMIPPPFGRSRFEFQLTRILTGITKIIDGIILVVSLGFYNPTTTLKFTTWTHSRRTKKQNNEYDW